MSLMIGMAAFLVVFGLVVWLLERRKGDRYTGRVLVAGLPGISGRVLLVGLPGIYLAGLASSGAPKWLYIPGLGLMAVSYLMQIVIWHRQRASKNAAPPDENGSA